MIYNQSQSRSTFNPVDRKVVCICKCWRVLTQDLPEILVPQRTVKVDQDSTGFLFWTKIPDFLHEVWCGAWTVRQLPVLQTQVELGVIEAPDQKIQKTQTCRKSFSLLLFHFKFLSHLLNPGKQQMTWTGCDATTCNDSTSERSRNRRETDDVAVQSLVWHQKKSLSHDLHGGGGAKKNPMGW